MTGTACQVFEVPCSSKVSKLLGAELWAVVTDHLVRNSIAGEVTFQLENCGSRFGTWQPVYFPKVAVVVNGD